MDFISKMQTYQDNTSVTENGMPGFKTTFLPMVDMNFFVSSYRAADEETIVHDYEAILKSKDYKYALRFLFYIRDIRNGLGERRLFRVCLKTLLEHNFKDIDNIAKDVIYKFIPTFGRLDDLFSLLDTKYKDLVISYIKETLNSDLKNMKENKPVSLLTKWMPSENASSFETRNLARFLQKELGFTPKTYRKTLSSLRSYLNVTEVLISSNRWSEVNYNKVSSNANLKYEEAFLRHDEERRTKYLQDLINNSDVKMNASVLFPHEIVHKYLNNNYKVEDYNESLELLWKNLKQSNSLDDTIVVRDGSGSMLCKIAGTKYTPLDVSTALAVYCAEHLKGTFKNKFITFSMETRLIDLSKELTLKDKLNKTFEYFDCSITNIDSVFNLIYNVAILNDVPQDEMPKQILIISDMEFDPTCGKKNVISTWRDTFKNAGYELPKIIFWNVYSRTKTIPCIKNKNGLVLISGFSINILDQINESKDSHQLLIDILEGERYKIIPLLKI